MVPGVPLPGTSFDWDDALLRRMGEAAITGEADFSAFTPVARLASLLLGSPLGAVTLSITTPSG